MSKAAQLKRDCKPPIECLHSDDEAHLWENVFELTANTPSFPGDEEIAAWNVILHLRKKHGDPIPRRVINRERNHLIEHGRMSPHLMDVALRANRRRNPQVAPPGEARDVITTYEYRDHDITISRSNARFRFDVSGPVVTGYSHGYETGDDAAQAAEGAVDEPDWAPQNHTALRDRLMR